MVNQERMPTKETKRVRFLVKNHYIEEVDYIMRHVETTAIGMDSSIQLLLESVGHQSKWLDAFHFIALQLQCSYGAFIVRDTLKSTCVG